MEDPKLAQLLPDGEYEELRAMAAAALVTTARR